MRYGSQIDEQHKLEHAQTVHAVHVPSIVEELADARMPAGRQMLVGHLV